MADYPTKTRGMGLPYGENFMILTNRFCHDAPVGTSLTDRRTGDSTCALSICYAVSLKITRKPCCRRESARCRCNFRSI